MIDLYCGDCLDVMQDIPDASVDAIITDIPYGTTACKWDTVIPFEPMWKQSKRIIKSHGAIVLFGAQPFTSALVMSNPKWFRYQWVWDKVDMYTGSLNANRQPLRRHEDILVFYEGQSIYNKQYRQGKPYFRERKVSKSVGHHISEQDYDRTPTINTGNHNPCSILDIRAGTGRARLGQHPTQKPVELLEYLIKTYTNEGDTVLDFTMGSGTAGVAAINTNRSFIGIEKDEHYFDIASARIQKAWDEQEMEVTHG